jgi:D-arginine dehydrogenase
LAQKASREPIVVAFLLLVSVVPVNFATAFISVHCRRRSIRNAIRGSLEISAGHGVDNAVAAFASAKDSNVTSRDVDIVVIGAGIVGIATTYFLVTQHKHSRLLIVDVGQPMTLTSAQSGENFRNWWLHPIMTAFTDHSIGLMEGIARKTDNRLHMTRRGYLLATREAKPEALLRQLYDGYGAAAEDAIRIHEGKSASSYQPPLAAAWELSPSGVDVLLERGLIGKHYPDLDPEIATILHIRRAGDIRGQQLGQYMPEALRRHAHGEVTK